MKRLIRLMITILLTLLITSCVTTPEHYQPQEPVEVNLVDPIAPDKPAITFIQNTDSVSLSIDDARLLAKYLTDVDIYVEDVNAIIDGYKELLNGESENE